MVPTIAITLNQMLELGASLSLEITGFYFQNLEAYEVQVQYNGFLQEINFTKWPLVNWTLTQNSSFSILARLGKSLLLLFQQFPSKYPSIDSSADNFSYNNNILSSLNQSAKIPQNLFISLTSLNVNYSSILFLKSHNHFISLSFIEFLAPSLSICEKKDETFNSVTGIQPSAFVTNVKWW